jgi:hypothetical protein
VVRLDVERALGTGRGGGDGLGGVERRWGLGVEGGLVGCLVGLVPELEPDPEFALT